jgi:protein SCO1
MKSNWADKTGTQTRRQRRRAAMLVGLLLAAFAVGGCGRKQASPAADAEPAHKRYPLTGEVLQVDAEHKSLRVRHDEIKGFMPAMTMDFDVSVGDVQVAKVGQRIRAELVDVGGGEFRLEKIWPADPATTAAVEAAAKALTQDTVSKGKQAYREVGERVPEFSLYDQEGRVISINRFRGKHVMLNFIFTRCPVAKMCPAAVARFQQMQRRVRDEHLGAVEFVSITLDPDFDTPGVLKEYALQRSIDTSNYTFLTGPEMAIKSLLSQFGVLLQLEGELITHTAATLLIDPSGRIVHRVDGSEWAVDDFMVKLKKP